MTEHAMLINEAMSALSRYELTSCARQPFATLSGGQQARLQILLLELAGSTLLLLDEPTDNLDLASAEALQDGLEPYPGTVLAVTHDRWFARSFDRFLVFGGDGRSTSQRSRCGTRHAWPGHARSGLLGCRILGGAGTPGRLPEAGAGGIKHREEVARGRSARTQRIRCMAEGPGRPG